MRVQIVLCRQGTEMMDGPLMGEFEGEVKDLEADSWSLCVEQQYLQILDREVVKRQDVIYGTSNHHTDLWDFLKINNFFFCFAPCFAPLASCTYHRLRAVAFSNKKIR